MSKDIVSLSDKAIIPSRSRYQIRHFVVGQYDTPEMQYRQILIEAQDLAYKIKMAELDVQKKKIEIERLLATGDAIDAIEAEEKRIGIVITERTLAGARIELDCLAELAMEVGDYTLEEIENNQPEYWHKRLNRQAGLEKMGSLEGISAGNLASMLQIGILNKEGEVAVDEVHHLETQVD